MRKQTSRVMAMMILVAGLTVSAQAQSNGTHFIARIPFEFTAGDAKLPAGEYAVSSVNPSSDRIVIQIRQVNGKSSAMLPMRGVTGRVSERGRLIFNRYGDRYFFAQAWSAGDSAGLEARKSSTEITQAREVAASRHRTEAVSLVSPR